MREDAGGTALPVHAVSLPHCCSNRLLRRTAPWAPTCSVYEELGKGKHSTVYKARRKKTIHYYAIKSVDIAQKSRVLQEVLWPDPQHNLTPVPDHCSTHTRRRRSCTSIAVWAPDAGVQMR